MLEKLQSKFKRNKGLDSLDELVRVTESYLSKLHDDVRTVVKESRSNESKELCK